MATKTDFILNEALSMSPAERATIAHCLISSLDPPQDKNVDAEWIKLAQKRLADLENGSVEPVSWEIVKIRAQLPARRAYSPEGGPGFGSPQLPARRAYSSERGVMKMATFTSNAWVSGVPPEADQVSATEVDPLDGSRS